MDSHVKSINTDKRSKKRIKFASVKQRSKRASADVYRSYKRKIGVTSAATREEFVHNSQGTERNRKRHRSSHSPLEDSNRTAVVKVSAKDEEISSDEPEIELNVSSTFAEELDVALDRNASEIFSKFHRQMWLLVRSLPEILHHSEKIIDLLMSYMLSPASLPERPSDLQEKSSQSSRKEYIINHATTDILHLLAVLARDLRHEIHVYLHSKILPRIIEDLLNPPPPPPNSGKQPIPLDVTIVEAAFRTLSYVLRYDSHVLNDELEAMRKYYGATLVNRRELVRRLAAETFSPQIRKLKSQNSRQRHLKRVLKALAAAEDQPVTHHSQRAQSDAVDGISQLIFQIVRGVPGKLHSQAHPSLQFVLSFCIGRGSNLIFSVASTLLNRLCNSMDDANMAGVAEMLVTLMNASIATYSKENRKESSASFQPVLYSLKLLRQISSVRSGSHLLQQDNQHLKSLSDSIEKVCNGPAFSRNSSEESIETLKELCPVWKTLETKSWAASWLEKCLSGLLTVNSKNIDAVQSFAVTISRELLPHLTEVSVLNAVGSKILTAAASIAKHDPSTALLITFSVASKRLSDETNETETINDIASDHKKENLIFFKDGKNYKVSASEKESICSCCHLSVQEKSYSRDLIAKILVALQCAPFVTFLSCDDESKERTKQYFKQASRWMINVLGFLEDATEQEAVVAKSIALEALANLLLEYLNFSGDSSGVEKAVLQGKRVAESLILTNSGSLWAMRGVSSMTRVLLKLNLHLDNNLDQVFDALVPNLRNKSHALRLNTLEVLVSYPEKYFVTDHSDIDFDGDLDEEPSYKPTGESGKKQGPTGLCDVLQTMYRLESTPVKLANERKFAALISKIEVMARSGRLPVVYAEAATNHMLGSFYIKFAPVWPAATRCLISLLKGHEEIAWPAIETKLINVMKRSPNRQEATHDIGEPAEILCFDDYLSACLKWQDTSGFDVSVFGQSLSSLKEDEIPSFHMTDEETVMESVWGVAEQSQQTLAKNSRLIVPAFISFLHNQYYVFHLSDPDARELELHKHVGEDQCEKYQGIEKSIIQKRLVCFLKVFAVLDGPKQLVNHKLLEKVFRSFLGHQEELIAQLAVACLSKYKAHYFLPYRSMFDEILRKGELKEALLKFAEYFNEGKVENSHREFLLPLIARLLFGRLAGKGKRSSKDSPAARRAAILSFLSVVCKEKGELFSFIYLMTRQFIPRKESVLPVECSTEDDRERAMNMLMTIGPEDLVLLPSAVIEGFLHLLETVVSQLGHRVISFVPHFTSIILALCNVAADAKSRREIISNDDSISQDNYNHLEGRFSAIRSLCYQRLAEIFGQFATSVDFQSFACPMWEALDRSINFLPEMVVKSEKAPAILVLLETMSTDWRLIEMVGMYDTAVQSVVKCIAESSLLPVMNSSLSFVENLLTVHEPSSSASSERTGLRLIKKYIPVLMEQFTMRLKNGSLHESEARPKRSNHSKPGSGNRSTTWRRELRILCQVSELISDQDGEGLRDKSSILSNLVSLLLPYLDPDHMTMDEDKLNVVSILKSTVTQLQPEAMPEIFASVSSVLAPYKGRPGMKSLQLRHSIASLVEAMASVDKQYVYVAKTLLKLTAIHSKRVDELDFETVIPELNKLSHLEKENNWVCLSGKPNAGPLLLNPLVSTCFQFLHNEDGVILRISLNALKTLVSIAERKSKDPTNESEGTNIWIKLVESSVVPLARSGLQSRDVSIRRSYILLVKEIAKTFQKHSSPNLCGDLHMICDDENPDLDFFMNITHMQVHRRARGFQKLRKVINEANTDSDKSLFHPQSLSNVLLPIAMHPIYECKTKAEETFVLEAIATIGSISRLLSWNKYNNMLWTILTHFDRYPEQERYLVGAVCAIIDGFSFDLTTSEKAESSEVTKSAVWRSLESRMIPKLEGLLTKEIVDKSGSRIKTIRPTIILALLKLFQKFPESFFELKLPHLLSVICDALRSKDSDIRDVARKTMAKMVVSMDLKYLADVLREVAITLTEGYKLHVKAAVVHTILKELSTGYKPPSTTSIDTTKPLFFDMCIAALMEMIQEDLFGEANERRESTETNVRYVKEAGGLKSFDSVELMCRMINFKPSDAKDGSETKSSVHCVVSPLLERLRLPDVDTATIRKIRQVLTRVAVGISNNPSVSAHQLFPFVYATVEPFIGTQTILAAQRSHNETNEDVEDPDRPIQISGGRDQRQKKEKPKKGRVTEWRPSTLKSSESTKAALDSKREERKELRKVRDGASAPKLTGTSRHAITNELSIQGLNDPASISAVVFGLNLLNSCLKKLDLNDKTLPSMMDPFVPLLTACVCFCRESDVALVGLKCLMSFLRYNLPSIASCSESLGTQALTFLTSAGSSLNQNPDLVQACFRTLTYLIKSGEPDNEEVEKGRIVLEDGDGERVLAKSNRMPLDAEQMKVLISHIQMSVTESDQHNPALGLIKAILTRRFMSPEFYDLMETLLKLVVRSHNAALRQQSSTIFVRYLLDYPMGEGRFEKHLKQIVANMNYEYKDGRMSAIDLTATVIEKVPKELLEKHMQLFFLALVLQMVNDDSNDCRQGVIKCLELLFTRSSATMLQDIHNYVLRWSKQPGPMTVASLQVFAVFIESRSDFVKQNEILSQLSQNLEKHLHKSQSEWEILYFSLICVEKLSKGFESRLSKAKDLWTGIVECLANSHPWVRLASCRVLHKFLASSGLNSVLENNLGMLYQIGRNLCFQMNAGEDDFNTEQSELSIKTLTLILPIMKERPYLCFEKDKEADGRDPIKWVLNRLSQIAKAKGSKRRIGVFKCFAAFATCHSDIVSPYLELMLEPLHRSQIESRNVLENPSLSQKEDLGGEITNESNLAAEVFQLLEDTTVSADAFWKALASVKSRALDKKEQRKLEMKLEAANDPQAAAQRKIKKQEQEKKRKKRRVEERRQERGATKKRRNWN